MDFIEKTFKEALARIAVVAMVEPIKKQLAEIGITLEYQVTKIDTEYIDKLAEQHEENIKNGYDKEESLEKILGHKISNAHDKDNISSDELIKYFMDKENSNETAKTDN